LGLTKECDCTCFTPIGTADRTVTVSADESCKVAEGWSPGCSMIDWSGGEAEEVAGSLGLCHDLTPTEDGSSLP
jgi:hypothetical protein